MRDWIDFSGREKLEQTIEQTWIEFRDALISGKFLYSDIEMAMNEEFLWAFNDLFINHGQKERFTKSFRELRESGVVLARGANLKDSNTVEYSRFIPAKEFIKEDNRFSPKGVEWLYIAIGETEMIANNCTIKECKAQPGQNFAICNFKLDAAFDEKILVDLTIANEKSFDEINSNLKSQFETYIQLCVRNDGKTDVKQDIRDIVAPIVEEWSADTYAKMISQNIFKPVDIENKEYMYAPFQCFAYYFLEKGFSGIIYESTVYPEAKNVVLFNKKYAIPTGSIKYQIID